MDQSAAKKVNAALWAASDFYNEAKICGAAAQGHPWQYELTLDKTLLSEKYLSVVSASTNREPINLHEKTAEAMVIDSKDLLKTMTNSVIFI